MSRFESVGVIGAGIMGRGITHVALLAGLNVTLVDPFPAALTGSVAQFERDFAKLVTREQLTEQQAQDSLQRLTTTETYADLAPVDLVIEAVPEKLDLKLSVLASIAGAVSSRAVIASNTSSIPITQLAQAVAGPERFLGVHFFNPVPRMALVEIIRTISTDAGIADDLVTFTRERLGKTPIVIDDRPGFVVNALLVPYLLAAARMADSGYASPESIDSGMQLGAGHPMGPLALSDLVGLDTIVQVADSMYAETKDPAAIAPNNLRRMVEAGRFGRKSGQGFYTYDK